ncbi:MAG TPA: four helix bundle protein [Gemmatimonadaceae bacterium]|jgi:four helix bundle protein|nr:four helix bundle protein [Gemmatimonadaceae bacterium]
MLRNPFPATVPDYHRLEVWTLACELSDRVTEMVDRLGSRLRASKADQITRAADAIHENIAEGCGYNSDAQLAKYLRQARGSADELQDELETLDRRKLIATEYIDLLPRARVLCRKLSKFIDTVDPRNRRDQRDRRR